MQIELKSIFKSWKNAMDYINHVIYTCEYEENRPMDDTSPLDVTVACVCNQ